MIDFRQSLHFARRKAPVFGLFAACCSIAWAQPGGPGAPPPEGPPLGGMQQISRGPSVERELKQLTRLLTLTVEQQTQVKAILTDQRQQIDALFKPASTSASESTSGEAPLSAESSATTRASIKAIRDAAQSKIAGVLSDGQKIAFALWEKKQERAAAQEESEDMPPPPPDGGNGPPPDGGGGPGGGPGGGGPPGV